MFGVSVLVFLISVSVVIMLKMLVLWLNIKLSIVGLVGAFGVMMIIIIVNGGIDG